MNTIVSFVWWIVGFYWLVSGGEILLENASHLYWYGFNLLNVSFLKSENSLVFVRCHVSFV